MVYIGFFFGWFFVGDGLWFLLLGLGGFGLFFFSLLY